MAAIDFSPTEIALYVFQDAIHHLAKVCQQPLPSCCNSHALPQELKKLIPLKTQLGWHPPKKARLQPLRLLFDSVNLLKGEGEQTRGPHYWPAIALSNHKPVIPKPDVAPPDLQSLKKEIATVLSALTEKDWNNLSILSIILEKYTSYLSYGDPQKADSADISFFDLTKTTATVATILANQPTLDLETAELSLIVGDLSGIQEFIYTIASAGALKSLRARSFFLELVIEEVAHRVLKQLKLPRSSVIYVGGGNLYILAPAHADLSNRLKTLQNQFNTWFLDGYQGKLFLALTHFNFPLKDVSTSKFATHWASATQDLAIQKQQKFRDQLSQILAITPSHQPCKVCHRDDLPEKYYKPLKKEEPDSPEACPTCCEMFELGNHLFDVGVIVRSHQSEIIGAYSPSIKIDINDGNDPIYYHLFQQPKQVGITTDTNFLINNWNLEHYRFFQRGKHSVSVTPLLLGNYPQKYSGAIDDKPIITAEELANSAQGIKRVGYVRMDVDRLGQIFAHGLSGKEYDKRTLPRIAGLSRLMSYFFKVYLNSLAEDRLANETLISQQLKTDVQSHRVRKNLVFIYAGGDDLFISGTWNHLVDFSFDIYQAFRRYTANHPQITLSGGFSLGTPKYPLYRCAEESGEAEEAAKNNGRDSLGLFGEVFKWDAWLGKATENLIQSAYDDELLTENMSSKGTKTQKYLDSETIPEWFGIWPLVMWLNEQIRSQEYPRSFIRHLLATDQLQRQMIKVAELKKVKVSPTDLSGIRYYLHLPKIAYTLARLPREMQQQKDFDKFRQALKSPYNAPYFRAIATWIDLLHR